MRVIVSEFMSEAAVASLAARHDTHYDKDLVERPDALKASLVDADALIVRNKTRVDAELVAAAPLLKVVGRLGVGLDNIDVKACKARGVEVIAATGANAISVAEYAICTTLMLVRGVYSATRSVAAGKWPRNALSAGHEIAGKTLGIVGFGNTGRRVALLAQGLGMRVIGFDAHYAADAPLWAEHRVEPHTFAQIFASADVVTLHVPLTLATHNLVDAPLIATMKPGAILINTARGGVVDEPIAAFGPRLGGG